MKLTLPSWLLPRLPVPTRLPLALAGVVANSLGVDRTSRDRPKRILSSSAEVILYAVAGSSHPAVASRGSGA
jgi:hypothetical protein